MRFSLVFAGLTMAVLGLGAVHCNWAPRCESGDRDACDCGDGPQDRFAECLPDGSGYGECDCTPVCEPGTSEVCWCDIAKSHFERAPCLPDGSKFDDCPCACEPKETSPCACDDATAGVLTCEPSHQMGTDCDCASGHSDQPVLTGGACDRCSEEHCAAQRATCDEDPDCQAARQCYLDGMATGDCPGAACALVCDWDHGFTMKFVALAACEVKHCSTKCSRMQSCGAVNYFQVDLLANPDEMSLQDGGCLTNNCCDEGLACGEDIECLRALRFTNAAVNPALAPAEEPKPEGCDRYNTLMDCVEVCSDRWPRCQLGQD